MQQSLKNHLRQKTNGATRSESGTKWDVTRENCNEEKKTTAEFEHYRFYKVVVELNKRTNEVFERGKSIHKIHNNTRHF